MWGLAVLIYGFMKILTWKVRRTTAAPFWKHLAYLLAWPGMDVDAFLNGRSARRPLAAEWSFAACKTALGVVLLVVVCPAVAEFGANAIGWTGMLGIVFALHFGLFHLLSCLWRMLRIEARPIMNWPIIAQSLADFWGHRWNLAFRDLTNRIVFRPLARPLGASTAMLVGFVGSGLIHDLVISVPAGGGYGLPTLYFTLQGFAVVAQRSSWSSWHHRTTGVRGWLVTAGVLVLPCPLLFHPWFVQGVMAPFIQTMRIV